MFNRGDYLQPIASTARSYSSRDDAQIREKKEQKETFVCHQRPTGRIRKTKEEGIGETGTQSYGEVDKGEVFDSPPGDRRWIEAGLGEYTDRSKLTTRARE